MDTPTALPSLPECQSKPKADAGPNCAVSQGWASAVLLKYEQALWLLRAQKKGLDSAIARAEAKVEAAKEIIAAGGEPQAPAETLRRGRRPKAGARRMLRTDAGWQNIREYPAASSPNIPDQQRAPSAEGKAQ